MTMFADSDAAKIGLDAVKRDYPQFTGQGVRLLQVELDDGSGWTNPDANLYLPAVATLKTGFHATEVGKVLRSIAPNATIINMEENEFIKTLENSTIVNAVSIPSWDPKPPVWAVECHAYTATRNIGDVEICKAQDKRVLKYNLGSFAACGNSTAEIRGEWNRSLQTNIIGTPTSPKGDFPLGSGQTQPYPDYVIPTQWTSIAAPVIAAGYALLLEASGMDQDKAEEALKAAVTDGLPRFDKAMAAITGGVIVTQPPEQPPTMTETNLTSKASILSLFSSNYPNEGLDKLTSGTKEKCLHFNKSTAYTFTFQNDVMPTRIMVESANDFPERDPKKIFIWRDDENQDWVRVAAFEDTQNNWFTSRFQWKEFRFTSNLPSHRWKIGVESSGLPTPGDTGSGILQIAELEFWGSEIISDTPPDPPPPAVETNPIVDAFGVLLEKSILPSLDDKGIELLRSVFDSKVPAQ